MSTDPFDSLRESNPAPENRLPEPPMAMAERIMTADSRPSRGRAWPGWAVATAAAVAVLVVGGVWMVWLGPGSNNVAVEPTTSTSEITTTTRTITTVALDRDQQIAALLADEGEILQAIADLEATVAAMEVELAGAEGDELAALESHFEEASERHVEALQRLARITAELEALGVETSIGPATEVALPPSNSGVVYFLVDPVNGAGDPTLIPVERPFGLLSGPVDDTVRTTLEFLLAGPAPGESDGVPTISSAIPAGVSVDDITVSDGVATISLSSGFDGAPRAAVAQVVFTATRFGDIEAVRLESGGSAVSGEPLERDHFEDALPWILIESPTHWGQGENPLMVEGSANVFEATVSLALTDNEGLILWEGFTTATCGTGCRGDWSVTIPYDVDEPQMGSIIAWEESARDGSQTNLREHPIWLMPAPRSAEWQVIERMETESTGTADLQIYVPDVLGPEPMARGVREVIGTVVQEARAAFQSEEAITEAPAGDRKHRFSLGYRVLWQSNTHLVLEFSEYYEMAGAVHGFVDRYVVNLDLTTGTAIDVTDAFTEDGLIAFAGAVSWRAQDELGLVEVGCCDGDPTDHTAILPGGLLVTLDMLDGLPSAMGYFDLLFEWEEIDGLLDPVGPAAAVREQTPPCSAHGLTVKPADDGLPDAVAATRNRILDAATRCDWDAIAGIAGTDIAYTFGEPSDPIEYWQLLEARGGRPLYHLVELLNLPYAPIDGFDATYYVWPTAFSYDGWEAVPEADREMLVGLYPDLSEFEDFGGYFGWRTGITGDGGWNFFLEGD
ncbi:GerMN domain-containing protein [bacterium]|nr:GerMN domain-containing protein [bacterium]